MTNKLHAHVLSKHEHPNLFYIYCGQCGYISDSTNDKNIGRHFFQWIVENRDKPCPKCNARYSFVMQDNTIPKLLKNPHKK